MITLIALIDSPANVRIGFFVKLEDELFTVVRVHRGSVRHIFNLVDTKTGTVERTFIVDNENTMKVFVPNL